MAPSDTAIVDSGRHYDASNDPDDDEARRVARRRRREKKKEKKQERLVQQHLAAMGLDAHGDALDLYSLRTYPVREWTFTIPGCVHPVAMNPVVTAIAVMILWSIVIWLRADPIASRDWLLQTRDSFTMRFTWFYQGTKALLFFLMLFITYRYGHIVCGRLGDTREFSNVAYFCIMLCVGNGPAMQVFHVLEPLLHQQGGSDYVQTGYRSQDEIDMFAITMTLSNWCITSWTHFTVAGMCLALAFHRFRLPMTFRSCFYPILGPHTWGWMGDFIDGIAIVITVAGVMTSMGSMSNQLVWGFIYLGWIDDKTTDQEITSMQTTVVWVISAISVATVISGIHGAIPKVSIVAVALGLLLTFLVFIMDDTKFLLNLVVQAVGTSLQTNLFLNNFWTDAYGQLQEGSGRAVDGKSADVSWMGEWTVFYIAWVVTWTPIAGMCIARISRGRKLWEIFAYGFLAPVTFCTIWFGIWGGIALRQSRQGAELQVLGETYYNSSEYFLSDGSTVCYDVPQETVVVNGEVIFTNHLVGITPVCQLDDVEYNAIFNVLQSFSFPNDFTRGGLSHFLAYLYFIAVPVMFLVTSTTAAWIVDTMASSGRKNQHWTRRLFWIMTVALLTTVILASGGDKALFAIQDVSIVSGLPIAIVLCYMTQSIVLLCRAAERLDATDDYKIPDQPIFSMPLYGGVFNTMEYMVRFGRLDMTTREDGSHEFRVTKLHAMEFMKGLFIPFVSLYQILTLTYPTKPKTNSVVALCYGICFLGWFSLMVASVTKPGLQGVAWTTFVTQGCILASIRAQFRAKYNLRSNNVADLVGSLFVWPQVLAQMRLHYCDNDNDVPREKNKDATANI